MRIGVGLPSTVPGTPGGLLVDWARAAEAGPFSSLGVLDRLVYDSYDPFASLAAAAAVTERIGLVTMVVIGPLRPAGTLAKQAASVDAISGGRLTLGVALGARVEDYEVAGVPARGRGDRFDEQLLALRTSFADGAVFPRSARPNGPPLLVGGLTGRSYVRMARFADGYVHNGGPPRAFARAAEQARAAWTDAGRPGTPALWGQSYFALGDEETGARYLRNYYAFTGPFAEKIAAANLTTPQGVIDQIRGYEEAGCDELVLLPTVPDRAQLDHLADVVASAV